MERLMKSATLLRAGGSLLAAGVIVMATALAAGCGSDGTSTTPAVASATAAPMASATTPAPGATKAGNIEITDIRARTTVTDTTAVYLTIKNNGPADTLLSAAVDPAVAGMAQLHEMMASGGTISMQELKAGLPIPANGTVELKPGSYHLMVMNVKKPVARGDIVPVTLVFERAGSVAVKAVGQDISSDSNAGGMGGASASPTMAR